MGGASGKIYERIAKYGNGWYAPTRSPEELAPRLQELKRVADEVGRDYADLEITAMWTMGGGLDELQQYKELGVHRLVVPLPALREANPMDGVDKLHKEVIAKLG